MGVMKAAQIDRDNQLREDAIGRIDDLINSAYAAKEFALAGKFEDAVNQLEDIPGPCKRATQWLGELYAD